MPSFNVTISRSASETAMLKVKAKSQEDAEKKISDLLNKPHRIRLADLDTAKGVTVADVDFYSDDESSWEVY